MQGGQTVVEEPIRVSSVLTPSKSVSQRWYSCFLVMTLFAVLLLHSIYVQDGAVSLTKIMATLGPRSRAVNTIEACLQAGMSVARFDFSCFDIGYHQQTIDNLRIASRHENKLCGVMLDTVGPEILISNPTGNSIHLQADLLVTFTSDITVHPSSLLLPINYTGLAKEVKKGDTVFLGQYLFTGSETTSVWLEVSHTNGEDIICQVKNTATLTGFYFNLHISRVQVNLPTLTDYDKQIISTWGSRNNIDFISLHYTRHADDVREVRAFLANQNLQDTQIFAKVETVEGLMHFDEILKESDGLILARGNLGIDLPPEKAACCTSDLQLSLIMQLSEIVGTGEVFLFQKSAAYRCNMAGKPLIITRVVDSMAGNLRPTRAEATDVANAVLDGADGILLGGETFGGLYPVEAIKTVRKICAEAEYVYNQALNFKRIVKYAGEPMSHAESVASSAVRVAVKVHAAIIAVFTSSGAAVRLITKYRPSTPVLAIVTPLVRSNSIKWSLTGSMQARQLLGLRGVSSYLASTEASNIGVVNEESVLKLALHHGKKMGMLRPNDKVVVFQKIGDSSVVKVVEFDD